MANPASLPADTVLYCPAEPDGRMFPAGSAWPGDAWTSERGGKPVGGASVAQAAKDLIAAQDTIDSLSGQLSSKDHDLAQIAAQRDEAVGKVADLEQRALAAEKGQEDADGRARGYMTERDAARADHQAVSDQFTAANARVAELEPEAAKVPGLVADLEAANQTIADLNGQIAAAKPAKAAAKPDASAPDAPEAT